MQIEALATAITTTPTESKNLSWSQRFGDSLVSERRRRLEEFAKADELVLRLHSDRRFDETENLKLVGRTERPTAPTVAQSFRPVAGAELRAMALRA